MILINGTILDTFVDSIDESKFFHSTTPKRAYDEVTIPGRDGVLHLDKKRFEPYKLSIPVFIRSDFENRYRILLNFLNGLSGVVPVRCTPAPVQWGEGHYDGIFYGAIPAPDTGSFVQSGKVTIEFQCNPRWWLDADTNLTMNTLFTTANSAGDTMIRTCNLTMTSTSTLLLKCTMSSTDPGDARINYRYPSGTSTVLLATNTSAQTAWENDQYFDLATYVDAGDVVYLNLSRSDSWKIKTDIPNGVLTEYNVGETAKIFNSTPFNAQPLCVVNVIDDEYSPGATYLAQVAINGIIIRVLRTYATDHSGKPLYIDCETQDCYYMSGGVRYNANAYVSMYKNSLNAPTTDFPVLKPGQNTFAESIGTTYYYMPTASFAIIPRWYLI